MGMHFLTGYKWYVMKREEVQASTQHLTNLWLARLATIQEETHAGLWKALLLGNRTHMQPTKRRGNERHQEKWQDLSDGMVMLELDRLTEEQYH